MSAMPEPTRSLAGLLQRVDDRKLREVVRVVEASGQRSSLEPELAAMRCRLRKLKPQRPLTVRRLLTAPFEASLVVDQDTAWTFVVGRSQLKQLHEAILDRLDPAVVGRARALLSGRTVDDDAMLLEAGQQVWPLAAEALSSLAAAGPSAAPADWQRVTDLLLVGPELVPLLRQLLPLSPLLQPEEKEILAALLALAQAGSEDRLGTVLTVLVRAARSPAAIAQDIVEVAAEHASAPLRPLLDQVLAEHRASLGRQIALHVDTPDMPLAQAAEEAWQFAEALTDRDADAKGGGTARSGEDDLRARAASAARSRYAAAIEELIAPPAELCLDDKRIAVRVREEAARCCAKLGQAARRLTPGASLSRLTDAVLQKLTESEGPGTSNAGAEATVENARLIEILAGPEVAWRYLRERRS